ncbi:Protein EVI2B [Labeo rohita]|uniref:Protein EVI2B n=4 Tax=Labeo rohita TaxID=84645 RepID=A0ABQ8M0C6_LABRO|nr:Protein EVI2B [Labeo rohita]
MKTTPCTLIFLFSLPWSLNGHLTTSQKNITVTNKVENALEARNYTIDSETKNVVSFSSSVQTQYLTSHSEKQGIRLRSPNGEDETLRTKRSVLDDNLTTTSTHPEMQTQDTVSQQKELLKPTESSHRPHNTSSFQTENTTEDTAKPPNAITADVVTPEGKTSSGPFETQKGTQETSSTSDTVMDRNNTLSNTDLQTIHPTVNSTHQPSTMTHAHTSAIATGADFSGIVNTSVKTTEWTEVTNKSTSTQAPELEITATATTKPTKTLMTTKKTTTKKSPPPSKDKQKGNPGPAVAAVIGTTFFLMFIAIILILVRKRKIQRKQLENPEWAGPSPFLDGDVQPNLPTDEHETITRQGFNQMSISRYLSQRLSKHLTFGRNTNEEVLMGDILQGSTFGHQNPDEVQAPNGNPTAAQDSGVNKIQEGQASVDSSDTKTPVSENAQEPVMESKESKEPDNVTSSMSPGPNTVIKPLPPLVSIDLDSLSEEAAPLQTSDGGIVPPAPPLP